MRDRSGYGWFELIVGILLVLMGVITFVRPGQTLTVIVVFCGMLAIVTGISDIVFYVRSARFMGLGPTVSLITGVFSIMAGAMLLVYPSAGTWAMIVLLPIWFIAHCISRLSQLDVIRMTAGNFYYYFTLIVNIVGIVLGFLMIVRPLLSYYTAGFIIGVYLILMGIDMIVMAASRIGSTRW